MAAGDIEAWLILGMTSRLATTSHYPSFCTQGAGKRVSCVVPARKASGCARQLALSSNKLAAYACSQSVFMAPDALTAYATLALAVVTASLPYLVRPSPRPVCVAS